MADGKALYMQFINYAVVPGNARCLIASPGKGGVDNNTLQGAECVISPVERQVFQPVTDPIAKMRVTPLQITLDLLGIRIKQEFVMIEA